MVDQKGKEQGKNHQLFFEYMHSNCQILVYKTTDFGISKRIKDTWLYHWSKQFDVI